MNYILSTDVIINTMHALAAVQALGADDGARALLAPMLRRERSPLQALMVKNAFAEVIMRLGPIVADTSLGDETSEAPEGDAGSPDTEALDCLLSVELVTPSAFSSSRHGVVRRAMELAVALTALSMWCLAAGGGSGDGATRPARTLADSFTHVASRWYDALSASLAVPLRPAIRFGWDY